MIRNAQVGDRVKVGEKTGWTVRTVYRGKESDNRVVGHWDLRVGRTGTVVKIRRGTGMTTILYVEPDAPAGHGKIAFRPGELDRLEG
jgi:hypothetical protein